MKRTQTVTVWSIAVLALVAAGAVASARPEQTVPGQTDYRDPAELRRLVEEQSESYVLLDVRTDAEYAAGRIPTARNIPVQVLEQRPPDANRDTVVIVYCASGVRSGNARRILEDLGFTRVVDFGGINRWPYDVER